jgi:hypothetical protein
MHGDLPLEFWPDRGGSVYEALQEDLWGKLSVRPRLLYARLVPVRRKK